MEWLPPDRTPVAVRPRTGSPIRSYGARRSIAMRGDPSHRGEGRQRDRLPSSMILLDETHAKTRTTYSREPISPRGGKRPRTTSSISESAAAAAAAAAADSVVPTEAALLEHDKSGHQTPLFRLRRHLGSKGLDGLPPSRAVTTTRRTTLASTNAALTATRLSPNPVDKQGDTFGEAEAMVADEERSSPPTSPHRLRGGNYSRGWPTSSSVDEADSKKVETPIGVLTSRVDGAAAYHNVVNCGGSSPTAPAYEKPPRGQGLWPPVFARVKVAQQDEGSYRQEGTHQGDAGSPAAGVTLPQADQESRATEKQLARQEKAPLLSLTSEGPPSSLGASRGNFLSSMSTSDDACKRVREDLSRYMEGVRKRTSEDGTPCVTFPRNFDRVVGLMGRNDLEERSLQHEPKLGDAEGRKGCREGGGKGADCSPPWTKYLLDEGLDHTKTFSRYKGVFADEQTGEHRLMRGMAKMRELDIRLAKTTQRVRELRLQAREAGEEAERAAGAITGAEHQQLYHRSSGRGPIAMDDISDIAPQLPLHPGSQRAIPAPLTSPAGNNSRRAGADEPPNTQRSERSAAGGSQRGDCGGNGRPKGMAFVTQKFQGLGRKGRSSSLPSVAASASNSVACSPSDSPRTTGTSRGRVSGSREGANGGEDGGCTESGGGSSGGRDRECAGSGGGGSGVSFVVRNRRHVARARRRLTDEQESLVSRFLEDSDGLDSKGELIGEPAGVWAEIGLYGGLGASEAAARLTEIDAQLMAMGGVLLGERSEDGDAVQAASRGGKDSCGGLKPPPSGEEEPHGCGPSSGQRKAPPPPRVAGGAPGESALREQRRRREDRCRERAIDAALEKLRDSLFETSAAGEVRREKAVDEALELARAAPLNVQAGVRQGAGRVDSLLGGEGPQPIGEWEVKHALRQGEEELRGKELATSERIEELLATVRRESSGYQPPTSNLVDSGTLGQSRAVGAFPPGTSLDAFFSLALGSAHSTVNINTNSGSPELGSCIDDATITTPRENLSGNASENQESRKGVGTRRGGARTGGRRRNACKNVEAETPSDKASEEGQTLALRHETSDGGFTGGTSSQAREGASPGGFTSVAVSQGPQPARRPRPRKKKPAAGTAAAASAVPPEISALFRAPLLASRLDPPVAGVAAAAVASGGVHRRVPRTTAVAAASGIR